MTSNRVKSVASNRVPTPQWHTKVKYIQNNLTIKNPMYNPQYIGHSVIASATVAECSTEKFF